MPYIRVMGVCPNLVMLLTISWTLLSGVRHGVMIALAGGFTLDALSGAPFGAATFSLLAVALASGVAEANLFRWIDALPYAAAPVGTLLYNAVYVAFLQIAGLPISWAAAVAQVIAPMMLANTIVMVLVHLPMRWGKTRLVPGRTGVET